MSSTNNKIMKNGYYGTYHRNQFNKPDGIQVIRLSDNNVVIGCCEPDIGILKYKDGQFISGIRVIDKTNHLLLIIENGTFTIVDDHGKHHHLKITNDIMIKIRRFHDILKIKPLNPFNIDNYSKLLYDMTH